MANELERIPKYYRPIGLKTTDPVVGLTDSGLPVYQSKGGRQYHFVARPEDEDSRGSLARAWEAAKNVEVPSWSQVRDGIVESVKGIPASLRETVAGLQEMMFEKGDMLTTEDAVILAMQTGAVGAAGEAPEGALRVFAGFSKNQKKADEIGERILQDGYAEFKEAEPSYDGTFEDYRRDAVGGAKGKEILDRLGDMDDELQDEVFKKYGVFRLPDGMWRYEIPDWDADFKTDKGFEVKPGTVRRGTLSQLLDHPELFAAYPEAKDIEVRFEFRDSKALRGGFNPADNEIMINMNAFMMDNGNINKPDIMSTLVHEIQHYIQEVEGFDVGSNPKVAEAFLRMDHLKTEELHRAARLYDLLDDLESQGWDEVTDNFSSEWMKAELFSPEDLEGKNIIDGDVLVQTVTLKNSKTGETKVVPAPPSSPMRLFQMSGFLPNMQYVPSGSLKEIRSRLDQSLNQPFQGEIARQRMLDGHQAYQQILGEWEAREAAYRQGTVNKFVREDMHPADIEAEKNWFKGLRPKPREDSIIRNPNRGLIDESQIQAFRSQSRQTEGGSPGPR